MEYSDYLTGINEVYCQYYKCLNEYSSALNSDKRFNHIIPYGMLLMEYGRDISCLINNARYSSVIPLNRDLAECYRHAVNLCKTYADRDSFDRYIRYLYAADIEQNRSIYTSLENATPSYCGKEIELQNIKAKTIQILKAFFSNELDNAGDEKFVWEHVKLLWGRYQKYDNKAYEVGKALAENETFLSVEAPYVNSSSTYRTMCKSSHNNISSVESRMVIQKGDSQFICPNVPDRNIPGALSLTYYCMKDILIKTQTILNGAQSFH